MPLSKIELQAAFYPNSVQSGQKSGHPTNGQYDFCLFYDEKQSKPGSMSSACGAEDTDSISVGRKTLKKPFLRREMAFSYTSSTCFFKQHKQQEQ